MHFEIKKNIDCSDIKPAACSDKLIEKFLKEKIKLRADKDTDTVNGFLQIEHIANNHIIHVHIYDKDENPKSEHKTTFKKKSLTLDQAKKIINS